jgi:hypothetical protein
VELSELRPGAVVKSPILPEPIEVPVVRPFGDVVRSVAEPLLASGVGSESCLAAAT